MMTRTRQAMMTASAHVADQRRPDGTLRRSHLAVAIVSPEWIPAVGPAGTQKKEFTARLDGKQVGRLLLYREVDGSFDISGIGVQNIHQGRGVASQLLDFAFVETCADHFTLSTGTTGDGTLLVLTYGEGRRFGRRVVERPDRLGLAAHRSGAGAHESDFFEQDEPFDACEAPR